MCERLSPALLFVVIIQGESLRTRLTWPNMYNVLLSIRHHLPRLVALIPWPYTGNWGISGGGCSFENGHPFVWLWYILVVWNEMYQTLPTYNPQFRFRFVAGHFSWRWITRLCRKRTYMFWICHWKLVACYTHIGNILQTTSDKHLGTTYVWPFMWIQYMYANISQS